MKGEPNAMTDLEAANAQLAQSEKMASLGLLSAGLAHEINTPLGAIHSNNDTISRCIEKMKGMLQQEGHADENRRAALDLLGILEEVCHNTFLATERLIG